MRIINATDVFLADKVSLVGNYIKYDSWEHTSIEHFNSFLNWLDENFEYELKATGHSLNFHILQRAKAA